MLRNMDFLRKTFKSISGLPAYPTLPKLRASIDVGIHPMDGAAAFIDAGSPGLADSVQSGEGRQQAGVQVNDLACESLKERGLDDTHEARENDQIDARRD